MVFAAGRGTRMGELTHTTPKPLIRVAGKPLLDYALEQFERFGCERVVVNCHYLGDQIAAHVRARRSPSELLLSPEELLLETGGGVVQALPLLGEAPFFTANSDTIWLDARGGGGEPESALARLARAFDPERFDAVLLLQPLARAVGYRGPGNFDLAEDGELRRTAQPAHVFTGVQLLSPRLFAGRSPGIPFSLREIYREAERPDGRLHRIGGVVHEGEWLHVGTPEELHEAEAFWRQRPREAGA
jgi:MurNAc alpha-1-phosphate uridylyltransferase